ncbi:MAG TPA: hypothetical protein VF116_11520 [Ktedonobacterales bacterium]
MANPASYNVGQPDQIDTSPPEQRTSGGFGNSEQAIDYEELGAGERAALTPENQTPSELDQNAAERAPRTATTESDRGASVAPPPYAPAPESGELAGQRGEFGIGAPDVPLGLSPVEQARYRALRQIYDAIDAFAGSIPGAMRYTQRAKDTATRAIDQLQREAFGGANG